MKIVLPGFKFINDWEEGGVLHILAIYGSRCDEKGCNCGQKALNIFVMGFGISIYNKYKLKIF